MNQSSQIEKIKIRSSISEDAFDMVLIDLFEDCLTAALSYCKISAESLEGHAKEQAILAIVRESTIALYNQRGNEGTTGYSTGGQSASYDIVFETMAKKLLQGRCRAWR